MTRRRWENKAMTNAERSIGDRLVPWLAGLIIAAIAVVVAVCR